MESLGRRAGECTEGRAGERKLLSLKCKFHSNRATARLDICQYLACAACGSLVVCLWILPLAAGRQLAGQASGCPGRAGLAWGRGCC